MYAKEGVQEFTPPPSLRLVHVYYIICLGDAITGVRTKCLQKCAICDEGPSHIYTCDVLVTPHGAKAYFNPGAVVKFGPIGPEDESGIICYIKDPYRANDHPGFLNYQDFFTHVAAKNHFFLPVHLPLKSLDLKSNDSI